MTVYEVKEMPTCSSNTWFRCPWIIMQKHLNNFMEKQKSVKSLTGISFYVNFVDYMVDYDKNICVCIFLFTLVFLCILCHEHFVLMFIRSYSEQLHLSYSVKKDPSLAEHHGWSLVWIYILTFFSCSCGRKKRILRKDSTVGASRASPVKWLKG